MPETDDASTGGDSDLTDIVMSPSSKSMMDVSFESSSSTSPHQVPPLKRQKRVHFDVKSILQQSVRGTKAMESISEKKFCSKPDRHILVELCTSHLIEHYGDKPSSFIKGALAAAVVNLFPFLKDPDSPLGYEAWYAKGAAGRPATGYIEDHLRYVRKKKISLGKGATTSMCSSSSQEETTNEVAVSEPDIENQEHITMMTQWLKCNLEPKEKVADFMKRTAHHRKRQIKDPSISLQSILEDYPRLLDNGMIEQDFAYLYPGKEHSLYQKWSKFCMGIIDYATQWPNWRETLGLENVKLDELSADEKQNLAFLLLPIIFRGKANRSKGLCSFKEAVSSFVDVQPDVIDILQYAKDIDASKKPQPFLVCKGKILSPTQTFVILERRAVLHETLLKAIDYCFKATYVLDIAYQPACSLVWQFFQNVIYELRDKHVPNCIRDVRAYLNQKQ